MKSVPLVEVSAFEPFVDFLSKMGASPFAYSDKAHIPRGMMEKLDGRISKVQATRFLELIREDEGLPDLGLLVGQGFGPEHMGDLGKAMQQCATLGEAVGIYSKHLRDWWGGSEAWIEYSGDVASLHTRANDRLKIPRTVANQNGIFVLTNIIRLAAGPDWTPAMVQLPKVANSVPEDFPVTGEASLLFDEEEIAVQFPTRFLASPLRSPVPEQPPIAVSPHPRDPIEALEEVMGHAIRNGITPTVEMTGEMLGTSIRSLQRKLSERGFSYSRLLDRVRFRIARDLLLVDPHPPLAEIAGAAGYSGAGTFIRAFRRLTGMTPTQFARQPREIG